MFSYISAEKRAPKDHPSHSATSTIARIARWSSLSHESPQFAASYCEARASHKSSKPKDAGNGQPPDNPSNPTVDFHGERRSNDAHQSTTDPQARLARKGPGKEAKLSYIGHAWLGDQRLRNAGGGPHRAANRGGHG